MCVGGGGGNGGGGGKGGWAPNQGFVDFGGTDTSDPPSQGGGGGPGYKQPVAGVVDPVVESKEAEIVSGTTVTSDSASNAATARRRSQTLLTGTRRSLLGDPNLGQQSLLG